MDTFDSPRSSLPARLPTSRAVAPRGPQVGGALVESAPSAVSLQVAFRGARRYWWLVLILWVIGTSAAATGIYLKIRPSYRASSLLRVEPAATDLYGLKGNGDSLGTFQETQVQLITSSNVLTSAGTNPKVASLEKIQTAGDVVIELRKLLEVRVVSGTYLIEVGMTSNSPTEASTIVNAVVDAYLESNSEWSEGATRSQIQKLENYMKDLETKSDDLERRWREYASKGDVDLRLIEKFQRAGNAEKATESSSGTSTNRSTISVENYKNMQEELLKAELDLTEAESWLEIVKKFMNKPATPAAAAPDEDRIKQLVDKKFMMDPEVRDLAQRMREAKSKVDAVKRVSAIKGDPAELKATRALRALETQYADLYATKEAMYREQMETPGGAGATPEVEAQQAEAKVLALRNRIATLKGKISKLDVETKRQATDEVEIALLTDRRSGIRAMQEMVQRRLEQLKFEQKGEARIRLVHEAVPAGKPIADNRFKYLAMTPVGVLGTVLGLIVLLEIRSGRVADPDVLSSRVKHEVFSVAPLPEMKADANDERAEQKLARFVQSLDHLRVALCDGGQPGEGRCVMITSATGGEGKTTLSAHLAARCANAGTSTVLIDADMRRASLGRLLDVPVGPGLCDVLSGDLELEEALITVQAGGFHFLSAGTPGRDPSRVLKSNRLAELIGRLRRTYDLVIIDTPPVLPVPDALIMGRWADGAVMAARYDASRLPLVERANRQLAAAGIPVLGVVVNGVRGQESSYGNYAYSYNYPGHPEPTSSTPTA
jgi:capsular exopolysaccharide synthesis family protein